MHSLCQYFTPNLPVDITMLQGTGDFIHSVLEIQMLARTRLWHRYKDVGITWPFRHGLSKTRNLTFTPFFFVKSSACCTCIKVGCANTSCVRAKVSSRSEATQEHLVKWQVKINHFNYFKLGIIDYWSLVSGNLRVLRLAIFIPLRTI